MRYIIIFTIGILFFYSIIAKSACNFSRRIIENENNKISILLKGE